jgi:4-hydroxythreonine-4-phosphate dehydrogenase
MLVITLGDPLSISIAALSPLLNKLDRPRRFPVVVVGSLWQWRDQHKRLGLVSPELKVITELSSACDLQQCYFLDSGGAERSADECSTPERGAIAFQALYALDGFTPQNQLAVLTCPINKLHCAEAGFSDVGQTEYFQRLWRHPAIMVLAGPELRVGLATNHIPLAEVSQRLTVEVLSQKIALFEKTLQRNFGVPSPRIAVCGLNPHNGEGGLCSRGEEERVIVPAVQAYSQAHPLARIAGPFPADSVFWGARQGRWDGVLALYHDQGLGPFKTLHFDDGINVSGGLPYLRVSPDHGPVEEFYLKEGASYRSFSRAWHFAWEYLEKQ